MSTADHWNHRYAATDVEQVSWFESEATVSLAMIDAVGVTPEVSVVDVGGGASPLVDGLLARGFTDVTVVDVSAVALDAAKRRLGAAAADVTWVRADVSGWSPQRRFGLWHDRAVFHFLTEPDDRRRYVATIRRALAPGAAVVVGTFAADGPDHCSGLPVVGYDAEALVATLADGAPLQLVAARRQLHRTPAGTEQPFIWIAGRVTT